MKNKPLTDCIATNASGWDEAGDYGDLQLYEATLEIDTKKFKRGDKVDCITFLFSQGVCQIYKDVGEPDLNGFTESNVVEEFPIKLVVG